MKTKQALLAIAFALPFGALAQSQDQLVDRYTEFAGSKANATSLVNGLRDGKQVKLTRNGTTETFTPPTEKMGNGNVDNALAIAEASLKEKGITNPTPAQIETAVMGVLDRRAKGEGWGQIAQFYGFKLGELKRADKADPAGSGQSAARAERPAKPENGKPEKPERPDRPERPGKGR